MSESIKINIPSIIFASLFEISFLFIFSYYNIKYYLGKKYIIFIGCAGFFCSVFIEGVILSLFAKIFSDSAYIITPLSLLFPGLFEETGRYLCYKFFLANETNKLTAISYGVGHGGFESFLLGFAFLRFIFAKDALVNQGFLKEDVTFMYCFLGVIERIAAIYLQMSLSVLVYKSFKEKDIRWFILAIILHDFVDLFAIIYRKDLIKNMFVIELIICLFSFFISRYAYKIYINLDNLTKEEVIQQNFPLKDKKENEQNNIDQNNDNSSEKIE